MIEPLSYSINIDDVLYNCPLESNGLGKPIVLLFENWIIAHAPTRVERYLNRSSQDPFSYSGYPLQVYLKTVIA